MVDRSILNRLHVSGCQKLFAFHPRSNKPKWFTPDTNITTRSALKSVFIWNDCLALAAKSSGVTPSEPISSYVGKALMLPYLTGHQDSIHLMDTKDVTAASFVLDPNEYELVETNYRFDECTNVYVDVMYERERQNDHHKIYYVGFYQIRLMIEFNYPLIVCRDIKTKENYYPFYEVCEPEGTLFKTPNASAKNHWNRKDFEPTGLVMWNL